MTTCSELSEIQGATMLPDELCTPVSQSAIRYSCLRIHTLREPALRKARRSITRKHVRKRSSNAKKQLLPGSHTRTETSCAVSGWAIAQPVLD